MRLRFRQMKVADGVSSASSAEAALSETFGGLERIRPDLAAGESAEAERKDAGKPAKRSLELDRPLLDSEREAIAAEEGDGEKPKPKKEEKPEAARTAPPAEGEKVDGSDSESPGEDEAALDALLEKYQGKPRSMAQAIRGIRSLQTKTAEENKELNDRLEAAAAVLDNDYDWVDGKPVLKADVAARHLRAQRTNGNAALRMPSEDQVRAEVEGQFKEKALKMLEPEQVPAFMAEMKSVVDQTVNERMHAHKTQIETQRATMQVAVGDIVNRHIAAHPDDKDLLPLLDKFYAGIPDEVRTIAFLEDWVPFDRLAELLRTEKSLPKIVKDAYELGKKHRGQTATITEAGSPGRSRPTPQSGRGTQADSVAAFKERVLQGSGLASLDSIVGSR